MEKEKFIEMCKEQFITWEAVEEDLEKLFARKAINLNDCNENDYKEIYAVMDAIYRKESYGYTHGSAYPAVNRSQKTKSAKYYKYL